MRLWEQVAPGVKRSFRFAFFAAAVALIAASAPALKASSFEINVTYDSSVSGAPTGFLTAFADAVQVIEATYTDPITINMNVGWGEIDGSPLAGGNLGQSLTNQQGFYSYAQMKTALTNDAKSATDATAVANLPTIDPYGGTKFVMSNGEAKALGLLAGNAAGTDGFVGFDSTANWTFDPNNRAVPGDWDFIGIAEHEITEVMGRYGLSQNGAASGRYSPIDLFRYTAAANLALTPVNGTYFSIDGGNTVINTFNGTGGGDLSDWAGATVDSFNAFSTLGGEEDFTAGDIAEMDAIGYDLNATPEPSTVSMLALGFGAIFLLGRRKIQASRV